ncbi:hypothetical protein [Sunxiuqinia elliptica]|uniref:Uncharacterized protein n=1 Tax=Sunxiuqinia elliptica TaxID=655355 RepID=A0A4R6GW27_9BACT|nr:hypothetical protein [Sunxiuqinia elliptica]TDN98944.1 hypothetical protein DET52_10772 [Sunxiuqinia elliptica]TDO56385.1 hypothetical protein DET65_3936 [Sunxiuqinia elliptica]
MKTENVFKLLLLTFVTFFLGACDDDDPEPLSFYYDYYEVPVNGTRYIGPQTGSGDYSLQVENPYLLSASEEKGWSAPDGMIQLRGLLTGESILTITDNRTGETADLAIKVTDNYEALWISSLYWDESSSKIMDNEHPVFSKIPFVFLINNQARDVYFADRNGENSLTGNGIRIQGKGTYSLTMEDDKPCLTLTYAEDENGQLTDDASAVSTPHKFEITQSSEFLLHRLDETLNLGWETIAKAYPDSLRGEAITMKGVNSTYQLDAKFEQITISTGVLN